METFKNVLSVIGALAGMITAIISLYARFLDRDKQTSENSKVQKEERTAVAVSGPTPTTLELVEEAEVYRAPRFDSHKSEQIRNLVKGPAIAMLVVGFLGLGFNLVVAGFGFVDQFVTPLGINSPEPRVVDASSKLNGDVNTAERERGNAVMTIITLLSFSVACVMAIWAGYNMMNLRSYWLSMAGSLAVMPGSCFCCLAGLPVGIWSLTILLKPEVSAAFRGPSISANRPL